MRTVLAAILALATTVASIAFLLLFLVAPILVLAAFGIGLVLVERGSARG